MPDNHKHTPLPDLSSFTENQNRFPLDELARYFGKYVAWSMDGTQILASGDDWADLLERVRLEGIDPETVVLDYVDPPDRVRL